MRRVGLNGAIAAFMVCSLAMAACGGKKPPVARPAPPPPPPVASDASGRPPAPPEPVAEPTIVPPEPIRDDRISSASLDDLNRNSPLKPAFFEYDSSELNSDAQRALNDERRPPEAVPDLDRDHRRPLRRARDRRVQSGVGRTTCGYGARLPGVAWRFRRSAAHGELREGVPLRPGARRSGLREEPSGAFRHHGKVSL